MPFVNRHGDQKQPESRLNNIPDFLTFRFFPVILKPNVPLKQAVQEELSSIKEKVIPTQKASGYFCPFGMRSTDKLLTKGEGHG
jgi:hypothetical protein